MTDDKGMDEHSYSSPASAEVVQDASDGSGRPTPQRGTRFAGDVLKLTAGTVVAQALAIVASPVLTRVFGPEAFCLAAVFTSVVGIVSVVACLRYELAIMLPEDDEESAATLRLSLISAVIISGIAILVFLLAGRALAGWLNNPALAHYLPLAPLAILLAASFSALNYWNSRTRRYGRLSIARVTASTVTLGSQLGAGLTGWTSGGALISASIAGSAFSTTVLGGQIWRDDRGVLRRGLSASRVLIAAKRYRKFPVFSTWSAVMNSLSWQLPAFMLAGFFSPSVVGFYSLGYRVLALPMHLLGGAIAQVFHQRAARAKNEGVLGELVEAVFDRLVTYGVLPFVILGVIGRDLFGLVFGSTWGEAGVYAQILAPWTLFWFISSPMNTLFSVLEKQELGLTWNVAILVTRFGSLLLGGLIGNTHIGLAAFSGTGALLYGWLSLMTLRYAGASVKKGLQALGRSVAYSAPSAVVLIGLVLGNVAPAFQVIVALAACIVFYSLMTRRDSVLKGIVASCIRRITQREGAA